MLHETTIQENRRALLATVCLSNKDIELTNNSLNELERLVDTANYETVERSIQNRKSIDKRYYLVKDFIDSLKKR